ncbi:hypothetical protein HV346_08850 [Enterobacter sp. RHBSTW-00994]|uniref:hypothetical protein n=1 Tax=Enterobacter sp. RHBSTW-00994 TaxID=2742676 RepID=UPI0015EA3548|nr:hypothetical protein [Enterobacter sp. RHBSTW-00994]QLR42772.1 hypothetical protein HV346_08850 [Enterobacter sp. RHBSTW-00994]
MTISDIMALLGLLVGVVAAFFAWKAYSVSKELSFPAKKAHTNACYLKPLSKNAEDFRRFLEENNFKKIYLNIQFDSDDCEYAECDGESKFNVTATLTFWVDNFTPLKEGEVLNSFNSSSLLIQVSGAHERHLYWHKGGYRLQGYFALEGYGVQQGHSGCLLRPLPIT